MLAARIQFLLRQLKQRFIWIRIDIYQVGRVTGPERPLEGATSEPKSSAWR